jgi:hypothetical protein
MQKDRSSQTTKTLQTAGIKELRTTSRDTSDRLSWDGADHSPPPSSEVKNVRRYTSTLHTSSWHDA